MNTKIIHFLNGFEWFKNSTPRRLALLTAALLGIVVLPLILLTNLFWYHTTDWLKTLILVLLIMIMHYLLIYNTVEYFIYRKIKLIYKIIRKQKHPQNTPHEVYNMKIPVIEDTEAEVEEWIEENSKTLAELKKMEDFRREYIGNVSHELKTPIFILQGYLDTLLHGGMYDADVNYTYLQKAAQNADRLSQIVSDLDFITQHENGELVLQKKRFNVYSLVREIIEELHLFATNNHITIELKEGSSTSAVVFADREKIRQVLTNLVTNSIKYGREKGTTNISIYDMHREVLIEVSDNGIGIASQHLPRLFERFYRVDSSRSRQQGGSGLGLAIAKHIIEAHKRQIHVRSQIGIGTTFGFSLKKAKDS